LIDSDEMMRIYFRDIFWIHGRSDTYDITMASSFKEAEKFIADKDTRPNTIFLDVMMSVPGENNSTSEQVKRTLSFIEEIKKNKDLSCVKIIIFSNQKEESIKEEICRLGVDGYLIKGELMPKEIIDFTDKIHECNN
jgi:DNA-binding NarL/FixJ family response regulator